MANGSLGLSATNSGTVLCLELGDGLDSARLCFLLLRVRKTRLRRKASISNVLLVQVSERSGMVLIVLASWIVVERAPPHVVCEYGLELTLAVMFRVRWTVGCLEVPFAKLQHACADANWCACSCM